MNTTFTLPTKAPFFSRLARSRFRETELYRAALVLIPHEGSNPRNKVPMKGQICLNVSKYRCCISLSKRNSRATLLMQTIWTHPNLSVISVKRYFGRWFFKWITASSFVWMISSQMIAWFVNCSKCMAWATSGSRSRKAPYVARFRVLCSDIHKE